MKRNLRNLIENFYRFVAKIIPNKLRYFVIIDSWAKTTTGEYSKEIVTDLKVVDMINRIEKR